MLISKFLLPKKFKIIGWILLIPSFIFGVLWVAGVKLEIMAPVFAVWGNNGEIFTIIHKNIYNEIVAVPLLISLMMVSFSKETNEDEYITKIRLDSLLWSIYINYAFLLFALIFVFRDGFYNIMIYNMFTVLLLFIAKFYTAMNSVRKFDENNK